MSNKIIIVLLSFYSFIAHGGTAYVVQKPEVLAAMQAVSQDNYDKAIQLYQNVLNADPDDKAAAIGLVSVNLKRSSYDKAVILLEKYRKKFGKDDAYQTEMARYYAFTDQPQKALSLIKPLLKKDPTDDTLLDIKAYVLQRMN